MGECKSQNQSVAINQNNIFQILTVSTNSCVANWLRKSNLVCA